MSDASFWDERYRSANAIWSGDPNPQLVAEVTALVPGTALDVGCGEGADTVWLAERGWQVTGIDISTVALERGRSAAVAAGVSERVKWQQSDITASAPPEQTYDLVSVQFMQLAPQIRDSAFRGLAAAVKSGGTLLIVGHHPSDLETKVRRPRMPGVLYTAADITSLLATNEWDIVVSEARARNANDSEGRPVTVHDAILRAQRR